MCTSFIKKTEDNYLIGMNFDNNGMKYSINTRKKDWFIIYVDTGKIVLTLMEKAITEELQV